MFFLLRTMMAGVFRFRYRLSLFPEGVLAGNYMQMFSVRADGKGV
jgi:hypothetical protein